AVHQARQGECHPRAFSSLTPTPNTLQSSPRLPMICRQIGTPSFDTFHGTEIAGNPLRLNGSVRFVTAVCSAYSSPPIATRFAPTGGAGARRVGQTRNSARSNA